MTIRAVPQDINAWKLADRGRELFTIRYPSCDATTGVPITFQYNDVKEVMIHIESGNVVATITGALAHSAPANLTDGGVTFTLPLVSALGVPLFTVKAPTGTIAVSVFAWR